MIAAEMGGVRRDPRRGQRATRHRFAAALALALAAGAALAQSPEEVKRLPALIAADEVVYDRELDVVTARGNVEIVQGQRIVRADTVSFNRRANLVTASGNVSLVENTGDVIFADYAELTEDMREGVVQNFRALLADQSRLAATSGRRTQGNITVLRQVVYSACELCKEDPTRAPVWQLKAARAQHDQAARTVSYRDAWLEFGGVPLIYTPYLEHPDGTVRRESGLLVPRIGTSSVLGGFYVQPYFQTLGDSADVTAESYIYTKDNPMLAAEYRQRFTNGAITLNASGTYAHEYNDDNKRIGGEEFRGHVGGAGRWDLDDTWRTGFELARASDDTYLLRYKLMDRFRFIDRNTLTTRPYLEGFRGRSYANAEAFAFQGLREQDDPGQAPFVFPKLFYQYFFEPDSRGGHFRFDSYSYAIARSEGVDDQRTAAVFGYYLPYIASTGEVWNFQATVQGDLFNTSSLGQPSSDAFTPTDDGFHARLFPQVALGWRYPLTRVDAGIRTLIEPVASVVAAPRIGGQNQLPNEDSLAIDFDDTNLFRPSRFTGYDRVEGGQRINYGLNTALHQIGTPYRAGLFVGQSYRFQTDGKFPPESGLESNSSNIVGRLSFTAHEWLNGSYRFNFSADDFAASQTTAALRFGPDAANLTLAYSYISKASQPNLDFDLEQLATRFAVRIDENWRFAVRDVRQFGQDSGVLRFNTTLVYEDECFLFGIDFEHRNTGSRDDPPDTSVVLRFALRNLGETRFSAY